MLRRSGNNCHKQVERLGRRSTRHKRLDLSQAQRRASEATRCAFPCRHSAGAVLANASYQKKTPSGLTEQGLPTLRHEVDGRIFSNVILGAFQTSVKLAMNGYYEPSSGFWLGHGGIAPVWCASSRGSPIAASSRVKAANRSGCLGLGRHAPVGGTNFTAGLLLSHHGLSF